ncbi:hypothetical protein [Amycolatopsis sp. NPDC049868]|uniref:hypothetical protein n=1 Tax=Amycolatopsis sp. NPDC049868 TaxID=3363934 RepID=UPI003799C428
MPNVVVAGAGLTWLAAAISAREAGAAVTLLVKGGSEDVGGNATFSGGLFCSATTGRPGARGSARGTLTGHRAAHLSAIQQELKYLREVNKGLDRVQDEGQQNRSIDQRTGGAPRNA